MLHVAFPGIFVRILISSREKGPPSSCHEISKWIWWLISRHLFTRNADLTNVSFFSPSTFLERRSRWRKRCCDLSLRFQHFQTLWQMLACDHPNGCAAVGIFTHTCTRTRLKCTIVSKSFRGGNLTVISPDNKWCMENKRFWGGLQWKHHKL